MLKLVLDQIEFAANDYGRNVTFRIYDETDSVYDATGYTAIIKTLNNDGGQIVDDITGTWTTQNQGVGNFSYTSTKRISDDGFAKIEVSLEKSGEITSTRPERVIVHESPE